MKAGVNRRATRGPRRAVLLLPLLLALLPGRAITAHASPPPAAAPTGDVPRISLGEAIRQAIERNPTIRIQASQVAISEGLVQQADGAFDYTISAMLQGSYGKADRQESVSYQAGVSKLLDNGITVGPLAEAEQELSGNIAYTQTIVGLAFTVPLLQGLGSDVTMAQQRSAAVTLESQEYQLRYVTATQLLRGDPGVLVAQGRRGAARDRRPGGEPLPRAGLDDRGPGQGIDPARGTDHAGAREPRAVGREPDRRRAGSHRGGAEPRRADRPAERRRRERAARGRGAARSSRAWPRSTAAPSSAWCSSRSSAATICTRWRSSSSRTASCWSRRRTSSCPSCSCRSRAASAGSPRAHVKSRICCRATPR